MTNDEFNKSIKDEILKNIDAGKVTMRPKWHFILQAVLLVIGTVISVLTLVYVVSFIIFILHQTGVWFIPGFGVENWGAFLFSLPWLLILFAVLFIIILEILVRRYSFAYRKPLLYSTFGVVTIVLLGGSVLANTPFHRDLLARAHDNHLPFAGGLYRQFGEHGGPQNLTIGTITEKLENGLIIQNPQGEIIEINVNGDTDYQTGTNEDLMINDNIAVLGEHQDARVFADSIREIFGNDFPYDHYPVR